MFGLGLGEIIVILVLVFLLSPKDLVKVLRKLAKLKQWLSNARNQLRTLEQDLVANKPETNAESKDNNEP
jgi:Sec-independent protein translocase protein TatA